MLYLLQHMMRCAECGFLMGGSANTKKEVKRNGKLYKYEMDPPRRYYRCYGYQQMRLQCRAKPMIRAERLESLVWGEVKNALENPGLIVAGIEALNAQEDGGGLAEEAAEAERDLQKVQMEEDRAIRLYVSGKITEDQLDRQRRFITERLETLRARLDEHRSQQTALAEKRITVIGLGGGVQSSVMALMASGGAFDRVPDCAIFADTRWEPPSVYEHLEWLRDQLSFPTYVVDNGRSLREDVKALTNHSGSRNYVDIPVYLKGHAGEGDGIARRQCTDNYKIRPIRKKIRELLGVATTAARPRHNHRRAVARHLHRQRQTLQGVRPQQRRGLIFPKHYDGRHGIAVDGRSRLPVVHLYTPAVGQQEPALAHRLDAQLPQKARRERRERCAGVHRRIYLPRPLAVHAGNAQRPLECPHKEAFPSQSLPSHSTRFGGPLTDARTLDNGGPVRA